MVFLPDNNIRGIFLLFIAGHFTCKSSQVKSILFKLTNIAEMITYNWATYTSTKETVHTVKRKKQNKKQTKIIFIMCVRRLKQVAFLCAGRKGKKLSKVRMLTRQTSGRGL